jgi:ABC-type multidrug transport system permease subunit
MTSPVPRRTGGARALKVFGIIAGTCVALDVVLLLLKYAFGVESGLTSVLRVFVGWILLLALAGVLVSVIVVLVQRSSPPSSPPSTPSMGLAPGWYPDQSDPNLMRYFDGRTWTSGTAPRK